MSTTTAAAPAVGNLASIKRVSDLATAGKTAGPSNAMDQQAFLKLFTTQLKNQNPLDPMKNENFVAQLAQFSQLEATTNMASTLKAYVASTAGERMMASASLIGKKISVPNAPAMLEGGQSVQAAIDLPQGADGLTVEVLNAKGEVVRTASYSAQPIGTLALTWDGNDQAGNALPDGPYRMRAKAVVMGQNTSPTVAVLATVQSIAQTGANGDLQLQVQGGGVLNLSDVQRISQ